MTANPDMTIRDVRVTMLRLPWADDPWLKGHALGASRDILICDVETAGGVTGMGYLFVFRPGDEIDRGLSGGMHHPARQGQGRHRNRGDLARPLDGDDDLWPRRHRRDGDVGRSTSRCGMRSANAPACRCTGCGGTYRSEIPIYARAASAAPAATV